jgi:hypothetical protein
MKEIVFISLDHHQSNCHASYRIGTDLASLKNAPSIDEANFSSSHEQGKHLASSLNRILLYNTYSMP